MRIPVVLSCCLAILFLPASRADDVKPVRSSAAAPDGLKIAYDVRGKGGTALVFIHGWCCDREHWKHQVEVFAKDHRVVALDLGGHGESGKDRKVWSVPGLAGDVEAVIKAEKLKRVILVGHSMGGPVSLVTAKRMPGTIVAVVGVDTLQNAEYEWPQDQQKSFLAAFEKDFKATVRLGVEGMLPEKVDPKLREWIVERAQSQDPTMGLALFRDFPRMDPKAILKEAKVPVRCINAGAGVKFAMPTKPEINKKYADYDAVLMEGVGHYPMLEKPSEFNDKLREVLKEFAGKKS